MIKKSSVFLKIELCFYRQTARDRHLSRIELLIFITVSDAIVRWRKLC